MLVNPMLLEELTKDAGEDRAKKALKYLERIELTNVEYIDLNNFEISAKVYGNDVYNTYISVKNGEIEDISCTCPDYHNHYGVCKHTLATVLFFNERNFSNNQKEKETSKAKFRNFKQLVNVFYNEEIEEIDKVETVELKNSGSIKLEPKILYDKFTNSVKVEFKIGNRKMYKLKNLSEFYDRMMNKEFYRYGDKLQFVHVKEMFDKDSLELLDFILKYAEIIKYTNSNSNSNYRYFGNALSETNIVLGNSGIDEFFEIVKNKRIAFQRNYNEELIYFLDVDPEISFVLNKVEKSEYELVPNIDLFDINIIDGKDYKYLLIKDKLYRCSLDFQNTTLKFIQMFRQNYLTEVYLQEEDLVQLYSVIIPKVKNAVVLGNVEESEIEKRKRIDIRYEISAVSDIFSKIIRIFRDLDYETYTYLYKKYAYLSSGSEVITKEDCYVFLTELGNYILPRVNTPITSTQLLTAAANVKIHTSGIDKENIKDIQTIIDQLTPTQVEAQSKRFPEMEIQSNENGISYINPENKFEENSSHKKM